MVVKRIAADDLRQLWQLQLAYKQEIGEDAPTEQDFVRLAEAVKAERILFFVCVDAGEPVGCCSISPTFSTFNYRASGVFEDFYLLPAYRHKGLARTLVQYAIQDSGVGTLTVGCADCDVDLYRALGFTVPLGNLLAYDG